MVTKQPVFDGSTNLEQALDILPATGDIFDDEQYVDSSTETASDRELMMTTPDQDIQSDITELYDRAVNAFDDSMDQIESMDPKYVSRAMEVSKGYLDAALDAIKLKQQQHQHADKMQLALTKMANTKAPDAMGDDIVIVGDRNKILAELMKGQLPDKSDS